MSPKSTILVRFRMHKQTCFKAKPACGTVFFVLVLKLERGTITPVLLKLCVLTSHSGGAACLFIHHT